MNQPETNQTVDTMSSDSAQLLELYRKMVLIRHFEERVEDLFREGVIQGTTHPAIGQEAVAVGVCSALRAGDYVTSTHRGHGHFLAYGADPQRIMAELFGKVTGYSHGRGGSQLMADFASGFLGANGITGGSIPVAAGAALSARLRQSGQVAACFFGDGASNQGTFHEGLNLAGIWNLPVIYICENNMYAMSTPVHKAVPIPDIASRAASYGFPGHVVDGNDVLAVQRAMETAANRARNLEGPTLLECKTYRLSGHSRGDARVYRTREEEAEARRADPIVRFRKMLQESGVLNDDEDRAMQTDAENAVKRAVQFAIDSEYPDPSSLEEELFA